jgi:hypothetical protein
MASIASREESFKNITHFDGGSEEAACEIVSGEVVTEPPKLTPYYRINPLLLVITQ